MLKYVLYAIGVVLLVGLAGFGGFTAGKAQLPENVVLWDDANPNGLVMVGGEYLLEFTVYEAKAGSYHVLYTGYDVKGDVIGLVVPTELKLEIGSTYISRGAYVTNQGFDIFTIYSVVETWEGWDHGPPVEEDMKG